MIRLDLARFQLLAESHSPPAAGAERPREVGPVTGVQPVMGEVEEQLPDGRYRMLAAGQRFDTTLAAPARPGDRVLVMLPPGGSASSAQVQTPPSVHSEVSAAGQLVARLAAQLTNQSTPGTISAAQALLPEGPVDTAIAAAALRELVGLSGLFYESHQAAWVSGERDAEQLRREPQGRLDPTTVERRAAPAAPAAGSSDPRSPAGVNAVPDDARSANTPADRPLQLHPEAAPLVQQQINALEARHIVWNGEVWRGQPMRWEIEDAEQREPASAEPEQVWRTRIDLRLPRLGAVRALFTLGAAGVGLRLHAETQSTDVLFAQRLPELRGALASAGLNVAEIARDARART